VQNERGTRKVNDISFELKQGEILGIVGIAGNGQNELIEALTGMRRHAEGRIELLGNVLTGNSPRANRLGGMSYVPQNRIRTGSSVTSSLVENAVMGCHLKDFRRGKVLMDYKKAAYYTKDVVNRYGVKNQGIQSEASSLSGGNLQKLIVGREFSQQSKVLIIEDPTRGIDVGAIEFIWNEIVKQVEQEGVAVLLITYDLTEATNLSDRILVMYNGKIRKTIQGPDYDEKEIGLYMMGGGTND
jgi:simple sugar transport system ATP-binding protein